MADITKPDDLILPIPDSNKEQDLYKSLQDYSKSLTNTFSSLEDIEAITAGDGLTDTSNVFSVNVDDSTIEISADTLQVKALGIDTAQLAADAVEGTKIADDQIDSEHYVAGSIDNEHLAANSVDSDQYVDGSIDTIHIGDNQVTSGKLEDNLTFDQFPSTPSAAPDADYEVANKKYVDDGVAAISQDITLIYNTSMSTATNSTDIPIEQGKSYIVIFDLVNTGAASTLSLRFDNDTGNNYGNDGEAIGTSAEIDLATIDISGNEGFIFGKLCMDSYGTDKMAINGTITYTDTSSNVQVANVGGAWNNNAEVNSFEILASVAVTGNIKTYELNETV